MCGLFAYRGTDLPDADRLDEIALAASTRGPHAFGLYGRSEQAEWLYKHRGALARQWPSCASQAHSYPLLIGHCRLSTSGRLDDHCTMSNNQPLQRGPLVLAHNGIVPLEAPAEALFTRCDSEIALLYLHPVRGGTLAERVQAFLHRLPPTEPYALIVTDGGELVSACRGLPLYGRFEQGVYLCSRAFTGAVALPDGALLTTRGQEVAIHRESEVFA
jgi:glutamine phosphoribosylpyrophosphate amidotransferase